ncbi:MAG: ATP-binding cassette domain-containing protein [Sphingobacteriales bacterium]|nr:MAG: ATP-binding cassette domain-containing protein [Sphingobacteriales bacterium]
MQLSLKQLVPMPLKEKIVANGSSVWLQDIKFNQGEYIFIKAPSGTGKTTLIHALYGLRKDKEGSFEWNSKRDNILNTEDWSQLRSKDISVVFQDMRLFPELTALENLEVKRVLTNTVDKDIVGEWMNRLGIAHKKDSLAATLSYGEQQRVAIIRALLQPYKWLLMDEPFSHLDNANIDKATQLIQEVTTKNNAGLILVDLEPNEYFSYTQKLEL